jgi:hypothetical protein
MGRTPVLLAPRHFVPGYFHQVPPGQAKSDRLLLSGGPGRTALPVAPRSLRTPKVRPASGSITSRGGSEKSPETRAKAKRAICKIRFLSLCHRYLP